MEDTMLSRCIPDVCSLIKAGFLLGPIALTTTFAVPAFADINGPLQVIYLFPGLTDFGGPLANGVATAVHCFSFSPAAEGIQYVVRNSQGDLWELLRQTSTSSKQER
jgi:hypothetical protein